MGIKKLEHIGVVVDDLPAAIDFFTQLGLELKGQGKVDGELAGRIIALEDVETEIAMLQGPDGGSELELVKFHSPPLEPGDPQAPSNVPGLRHIAFLVDDLDTLVEGLQARGTDLIGELIQYGNSYRLCYVRGPEGIIVELAEKVS